MRYSRSAPGGYDRGVRGAPAAEVPVSRSQVSIPGPCFDPVLVSWRRIGVVPAFDLFVVSRLEPKELMTEAASEELLAFDLSSYLRVFACPVVHHVEMFSERYLPLLLRIVPEFDLHVADGAVDGGWGHSCG